MTLYRCPHCGSISISWDTRAGVYLCNVPSCSRWFDPPPISNLTKEAVATLISRGSIVVTQEWFDRHGERPMHFVENQAVES
jgi:hypothetical protein